VVEGSPRTAKFFEGYVDCNFSTAKPTQSATVKAIIVVATKGNRNKSRPRI